MSWFPFVFVFVSLFFPSTSVLINKTDGNMEFISPGTPASLSSARSWCKLHGSTLAELTSEHIRDLLLMFVYEFGWNKSNLTLNARGEELPVWKWISGETFTDIVSYPMRSNDTKMYARMTRNEEIISVEGSFPDCLPDKECRHGYVCELKEVSKCDVQSYYEMVLDGACYIFYHDEFLNWFEAYDECEGNNGRLATFRNLKGNEIQLAARLKKGMKYWIGLNRYEWRWIDSGELILYTNFESIPSWQRSFLSGWSIPFQENCAV